MHVQTSANMCILLELYHARKSQSHGTIRMLLGADGAQQQPRKKVRAKRSPPTPPAATPDEAGELVAKPNRVAEPDKEGRVKRTWRGLQAHC